MNWATRASRWCLFRDSPPRTKPKALNYALPFVSGEHVVVYDAEDIPEPGQLRLAASTFALRPETRSPAGRTRHRQCRRELADSPVRRRVCRAIRPDAAAAGPPRPAHAAAVGHPTISASARYARSAAGIRSTSPRMPISASASPAASSGPRPSPAAPPRKHRWPPPPGSSSARAG